MQPSCKELQLIYFQKSQLFGKNVQQFWKLFSIPPGTIINVFSWRRWNSKKPHKSQFFYKDVEHKAEYLKDSVYAAGGMAAVYKFKPLTSTFSEFAVRLLNALYQMEVDQKELMLFLTLFLTPLLWWNGNKNKLVDFIFKQWASNSGLIG